MGCSNYIPFYRAEDITKADTDQTKIFRAIYVGGTGDVKVDMEMGGTVTFKAVPVGKTLYGHFKRVYSTGTTATLMVGFY
jgi:hypothetical protein